MWSLVAWWFHGKVESLAGSKQKISRSCASHTQRIGWFIGIAHAKAELKDVGMENSPQVQAIWVLKAVHFGPKESTHSRLLLGKSLQ
jgi:hypothetical protein